MKMTEFKYKNNWWQGQMSRRKVNIRKGEQKYSILIQCKEIHEMQSDGNVQAKEIFHLKRTLPAVSLHFQTSVGLQELSCSPS